jgi:hypothetical protein
LGIVENRSRGVLLSRSSKTYCALTWVFGSGRAVTLRLACSVVTSPSRLSRGVLLGGETPFAPVR